MSDRESSGRKAGFSKWIESQARALREKGGVMGFDRLDPYVLAERMEIPVRCLSVFLPSIADSILPVIEEHDHCWDAAMMPGLRLIILNPKRTDPLRRHASIMEELAHCHLQHRPSSLIEVEGVVLRTCSKSVETQAYAVGAAALLPAFVLKGARTRGYSRQIVAEQHQISLDLVSFREKVTGVKLAA